MSTQCPSCHRSHAEPDNRASGQPQMTQIDEDARAYSCCNSQGAPSALICVICGTSSWLCGRCACRFHAQLAWQAQAAKYAHPGRRSNRASARLLVPRVNFLPASSLSSCTQPAGFCLAISPPSVPFVWFVVRRSPHVSPACRAAKRAASTNSTNVTNNHQVADAGEAFHSFLSRAPGIHHLHPRLREIALVARSQGQPIVQCAGRNQRVHCGHRPALPLKAPNHHTPL